MPGYELPVDLPDGEFDIDLRTQKITCQFDEEDGGKWTDIVACEPVRCKSLPPPQPAEGIFLYETSKCPLKRHFICELIHCLGTGTGIPSPYRPLTLTDNLGHYYFSV